MSLNYLSRAWNVKAFLCSSLLLRGVHLPQSVHMPSLAVP